MNKNNIINLYGISENRIAPAAAEIAKGKNSQLLIIVPSETKAKRLAVDLSFFAQKKAYVMPPDEDVFFRYDAKNHDLLHERIRILNALASGEECIVCAPVSAAVKKNPPCRVFKMNSIGLSQGRDVDVEELKKRLAKIGYERTQLVEAKGEFSVRGGIIDVFTPNADNPFRIELFGSEVDSIREFDADTQRSIQNLKSIRVIPSELMVNDNESFAMAIVKISKEYEEFIAELEKRGDCNLKPRIEQLRLRKSQLVEFLSNSINIQHMENYTNYFYDSPEYLWDYMISGSVLVDDPARIEEYLEARDMENKNDFEANLERGLVIPKDFENYAQKADFKKVYGKSSVYVCTPFKKTLLIPGREIEYRQVESRQTAVFHGRMGMLEEELKRYAGSGFDVTIVCSSDDRADNIADFVERCGLSGKVKTARGTLTGGIEFPLEKVCYIWDGDIFAPHKGGKPKAKKKLSNAQVIRSFSDMQKGDYVVHENHGIGKFLGVEQLTVQNVKKDYLKIKYAGEDMLYVPVEQMDIIQKYVGADSESPKINKLSSAEWRKTKAKAKAAIEDMAKELLEVSAKRKVTKGHAFSVDTAWQKEFEDGFEYQETEDQLRCVAEIKSDMEENFKMDRLLCGDVGFGKTEVAARALFKCAAEGKQAAVLVPTTILANQHYYTLKDRFEPFPFTVEMLSRFKSDKQQDEIVRQLKNGMVDIIIGTHRLLSSDVGFKDLGLLVIDEEQRFGVKHKEKIKKLKESVDILMLSATPIPRTLHMSLTGIRDMSLIEEPPEERYPVQTYVLEQEDRMIKEAIEKELGREGQVFVVSNRIHGIHKTAHKITELVPGAKVAIGHGQMNERALEDVMLDFIDGGTNVLVSTTIIESGIDIPNVNTIIILDCDRFGLSQLYQLRGRVGRSNRMAYAYLMFKKDKALSETAEKRLRAIREFTEFGSGFKVAMKDLEIRGAGNLLGSQQHGHMMMIGYELYCKLVDDAIKALGGEAVSLDREECSVELTASAFIPESYIADEVLKLQMYKKIASIVSKDDEIEIVDELVDRFGEIPKETLDLVKISRIRSMAETQRILRIHEQAGKIVFDFAESSGLNARMLVELSGTYGLRLFIHGGAKPFLRLSCGRNMGRLDEAAAFLAAMEGLA
ncbi:MAG: transcription-repair coupling factor [Clostridiales bacterium]|nr:transcription-repair coupling factor [Clostridiales bacterium]